jgi:hypothetical protein
VKNLLLLAIIAILSLTACDDISSSQLPTEPVYAKGSTRRSEPSTMYQRSTACGEGWTAFQGFYNKPLPFTGADTVKPLFQVGATSTGLNTWAVLNDGSMVPDTTKVPFFCTKD